MIVTGFLFTLGAVAGTIALLSSRKFWIAVGVVAAIILGFFTWVTVKTSTEEQEFFARSAHVEFALSRLPSDYPDADRTILRTELCNYFDGRYDMQHCPDLNMIDRYLASIDPSLVRK